MRKLLVTLLSVFTLGLGLAFAQTDVDTTEEGVVVEIEAQEGVEFDTTQFVGIALPFPLSVHYGLEDVQLFGTEPDLRFRFSGNVLVPNVSLGIDTLFDIATLEENIQIYGGPGLELGTVFPVIPSFGLVGLLGGEYRFNRELGFFLDVGTGISFPFNFLPRFAFGANYHF